MGSGIDTARQGSAGLAYAALASALLASYLLTMAPSWTFEDTPLFTAACGTLGVAHPPGYPLWVLTCAPFAELGRLIDLDPGHAAALSSVAASVAACLLLARLLHRVTGSAPAAIAGAGTCGLALTFWSQSIVAESYALNALLWIAALNVVAAYRGGGRPWLLVLLALLCGLGLANHWPLFVIASPSIALSLMPAWARLRADLRRLWPQLLLAGIVGVLPYAHLLLASESSARFFGGRLLEGSPLDLLDYVSRASLSELDLASQHPRWDHRFLAAGRSVLFVLESFSWPLAILGVAGLGLCIRRVPGWQFASMLWALLGVTFVLALYRPYLPQSDLSAQTFANYGLVAHFTIAAGIAFALARVLPLAPGRLHWPAAAAILLGVAAWHAPKAQRTADDLAPAFAAQVNASLPEGTRILLGTQSYSFALEFYPHLAPERSRLSPLPIVAYLGDEADSASLQGMLAAETDRMAFAPMLGQVGAPVTWHGTYGLLADHSSAGALVLDGSARDLLRHAAELRTRANSVWTRWFVDRLMFETARYAQRTELEGGSLKEEDARLLAELEAQPGVRFAAFLARIQRLADQRPQAVRENIARLGDLDEYPLPWRADVRHVLASAHAREGDLAGAVEVLEEALAEFPAASNRRVLADLLALLAQEGDYVRYRQIRRRYPALEAGGLEGSDQRCAANLGLACRR